MLPMSALSAHIRRAISRYTLKIIKGSSVLDESSTAICHLCGCIFAQGQILLRKCTRCAKRATHSILRGLHAFFFFAARIPFTKPFVMQTPGCSYCPAFSPKNASTTFFISAAAHVCLCSTSASRISSIAFGTGVCDRSASSSTNAKSDIVS